MMGGRIVAIVDDNLSLLNLLKLLLEIDGYEVLAYSSPASFLDDRATEPACLIVDQNMLELTGLELVARLRQEGSRIPVLLMTGSLSSDLVARAAELGIETTLEKPVEPGDFLKFVHEHC